VERGARRGRAHRRPGLTRKRADALLRVTRNVSVSPRSSGSLP
jgi:hypothetical protein